MSKPRRTALVAAMAAILAGTAPAVGRQAEPPASATSDRWNITVAPYL